MNKKAYNPDDWGHIRKCAECGKEFWFPYVQRYAYKVVYNGHLYRFFCCYSCMRKYEDKHPKRVYITKRGR